MSCFHPCCLQPVLQSIIALSFVVLLSLPSSECTTVKFHIPMRSESCFHPCLSFTMSVWQSVVTPPCVQCLVFTFAPLSLCCSLLSHSHAFRILFSPLSLSVSALQSIVTVLAIVCLSLYVHVLQSHAFKVLFSPMSLSVSALQSIVTVSALLSLSLSLSLSPPLSLSLCTCCSLLLHSHAFKALFSPLPPSVSVAVHYLQGGFSEPGRGRGGGVRGQTLGQRGGGYLRLRRRRGRVQGQRPQAHVS